MKPGDPELNPWFPVYFTNMVLGRDEYGAPKVEFAKVEARPDYYFWLGVDAYPVIPVISAVLPPLSTQSKLVLWNGYVGYY